MPFLLDTTIGKLMKSYKKVHGHFLTAWNLIWQEKNHFRTTSCASVGRLEVREVQARDAATNENHPLPDRAIAV